MAHADEFSPRDYGSLVSEAGVLVIATNGVYAREIAFLLETGRADAHILSRWVDVPKKSLEEFERRLSKCRPPRELKKFHGCFERGVRATILRWGSLRRAGLGSALQFETMAIDQFGAASQELSRLVERTPSLVSALQLDSSLISLLWRDIGWVSHAVIKDTESVGGRACQSCGASAELDARFCTECGHEIPPVPRACSSCGTRATDDAKYCRKCGSRLASS